MAQMLFLCIVYACVLKCAAMAIYTSSPVAPGTLTPESSVTQAKTNTVNRNTKKKVTSMDSSLLKYLRKFKYLDPSPCPSCEQDSSIISEALSTLQQWAHINNTGILDSDTVEVMSKRRCGVPDEPKQFSVSSIKNKRHKRGFFWQIYHGSRWYKNDLTYIINMPHKFPNKRAVEKIISAALHAWESVTQLTFTQKSYGYADIEVNFLTGRHGDGSPFDGNGGILAHAFFPYDNSPGLSGDAHFDADEDWGSEMDLNTTADLYCVAVHEFGHSLGLMHSRWPISIMWPWMKGDCTLSKFDIAVIQKIYGSASERKWKRPRPTAHPPQTTHPFIKPNWPTITTTTTITSTPFPSTASSSTRTSSSTTSTSSPSTTASSSSTPPIQTATTITTSTATILTTTNSIKTTETTALQSTRETISTAITTADRSPPTGHIPMADIQTERSSKRTKTIPITTSFANLFQQSTTMADIVLSNGNQMQETATPETAAPKTATSESPPTTQTSPSTISYPNILQSKNLLPTLNSLLFQTSSNLDTVYEKKSSGIPLSDQNGSIPPNQPSDENGLSYSAPTPNGLSLQTEMVSPNVLLSKGSSLNPNNSLPEKTSPTINILPFINSSSTPYSLSSQTRPSPPNDLSSELQTLDPNILAPVTTLFTQNVLPSQTLPSRATGLLFKSSVSDQTSSPPLNTLSITNTSPSNPHSLPSQNSPSQPSDLLFKSSLSDQKSSPLLYTLSITNTSPHSLPTAIPFYTYRNHQKNPHYLNEIGKIDIRMFSNLPKLPSSSLDRILYLKTSKEPVYLANSSLSGYQYQQKPDSAEEPTSSVKPKLKHSDLGKTEQSIQGFTSGTKRPKSSTADFQGYLLDARHSPEIQDQNSANGLVFRMHSFPKQNSSSPSTQLYKTATVSMTTKPVVSSNVLKWISMPTSQVTIDSEPTAIPRKTSPEISIGSHLSPEIIENKPGLQTDSYFDMVPSTKNLLFDKKANNDSQKRTFQIVTEQLNGDVFRSEHKAGKTDQNAEKTIENIKNKEELHERFHQEKTASEQPYILQERTNGKSQIKTIPFFQRNPYGKLEPTTSKNSKIYTKLQASQAPTSDKLKRKSSRVPLISSEAVPGFGEDLRQQNQEREVFLPSSSVVSTFLKSLALPTRDVPFVDINTSSLSSPTTLFPGGANTRKNRPFKVFGRRKRVKMLKPRFRQKFIQTLLHSTMHMIPPHGPPLRDTKFEPSTTPSWHQNRDVGTRTLPAPPTNRMLSRIVTSSFKAEPYLIPKAISHRYLSSQISPTTQKWTGDTQKNLPQLSNFRAPDPAKNYLWGSLRIMSPVQQTTPLLLTIQDPLRPQPITKDQGYNNRNSNLQASSLLPLWLKSPVSDQENVPTTSETIFHKTVTPHQHQKQQMVPLPIYAKKSKNNEEEIGSSSRIYKRSIDERAPNVDTTPNENWMSRYSLTLATLPSLVLQSTLYSHQLLNIPLRGDNTMKSSPERHIRYSETDGIATATMPTTDSRKSRVMKPSCSGLVQIDGATIDGNGTINIFNGTSVMRFPFCAKGCGRKRRRTFIPISRIFPNGPNNVTAAASIILGKKQRWERTYLFQGHLVWRYRKCRRRYCLDRDYPKNISQEFNVSTPIEVTAAYMHSRRRTLFLFNGTSFYQTVRCQRWIRRNGCSTTETAMQPGLLSSLRGIDAMFTHQGRFYVIHDGSYFTTMLRSMRNNVFQHGSIAENWYGCPRNNNNNQTLRN